MKKIYKTPRTKSINLESEALLQAASKTFFRGFKINENEIKDYEISDTKYDISTELSNEKVWGNVTKDDNMY